MTKKVKKPVLDVDGNEAKIGDTVCYATAGKGASGFRIGVVVRLCDSSVEIRRKYRHMYRSYDHALQSYTEPVERIALQETIRHNACFGIMYNGEYREPQIHDAP